MEWFDSLRALSLLITANATPVLIAKLSDGHCSAPLDFGYTLRDGERLFGAHKTWRGLVTGTTSCALVAALFELPLWIGAGFGAVSLLGDAVSSAIKRRLRFKPGTESIGLDQLGEALLPLLLFALPLSLDAIEVALVVFTFVVLDTATSKLRHRPWLKTQRK